MSKFNMKEYLARHATMRDPQERIKELLHANTEYQQKFAGLNEALNKAQEAAKLAIEKLGAYVVRASREAAAHSPPPVIVTNISRAVEDVLDERGRQRRAGFDGKHDDQHTMHELVRAAVVYALNNVRGEQNLMHRAGNMLNDLQPWHIQPGCDHRRNCVIAAAMLVAEIERIDRTHGSALADQQARAG